MKYCNNCKLSEKKEYGTHTSNVKTYCKPGRMVVGQIEWNKKPTCYKENSQ